MNVNTTERRSKKPGSGRSAWLVSTLAAAVGTAASAQEERTEVARADENRRADAEIPALSDWSYDPLYRGRRADTLLDAEARGSEGEAIGSIQNILLDERGGIVAVIVEIGSGPGAGEAHAAVPWSEVERSDDGDVVRISVSSNDLRGYSLFDEKYFSVFDLGDITVVEDDVIAGPGVWKATDLLDDYVFLENREGFGYVSDLIFAEDGRLQAVIASPDTSYDDLGRRAFPWLGSGYDYAWNPSLAYYALPYEAEEVASLPRFDFERMQ